MANEAKIVGVLRRLVDVSRPFLTEPSGRAADLADVREDAMDLIAAGGCLVDSAEDEPVFVLTARDPLAGDLVREWADRYEVKKIAEGDVTAKSKEKVAGARRLALEMDAWRAARYAVESVR